LLFEGDQYISGIEFIGLLHPSRWCLWFRSCIAELEGLPTNISGLYGVECLVKVLGIPPRYMIGFPMFGFMFDDSSMPNVKTFMNFICQ
jgi:hypothetical protein